MGAATRLRPSSPNTDLDAGRTSGRTVRLFPVPGGVPGPRVSGGTATRGGLTTAPIGTRSRSSVHTYSNGEARVDEYLRISIPRIFAAGDVIGRQTDRRLGSRMLEILLQGVSTRQVNLVPLESDDDSAVKRGTHGVGEIKLGRYA